MDFLLRSLAEEAGPLAIGIVLSGTASDGTLGLKAVKAARGVTFAQDEQSAQYYGMPGRAVASGCVDFVLAPAEIAKELTRIARHPYLLEQGNDYSVSLHPYKTHDQRIDGVVITFFEHAQLDGLSRLATVVRDASDAITLLDMTGRFLAWDHAAERLYGYSEKEALGLEFEAIVPEQDLDSARALTDRARRGEHLPPQRVRRGTKGGKVLEVWLTLSPLVDRTDEPKAMSSIEFPVESTNQENAGAGA